MSTHDYDKQDKHVGPFGPSGVEGVDAGIYDKTGLPEGWCGSIIYYDNAGERVDFPACELQAAHFYTGELWVRSRDKDTTCFGPWYLLYGMRLIASDEHGVLDIFMRLKTKVPDLHWKAWFLPTSVYETVPSKFGYFPELVKKGATPQLAHSLGAFGS